MINRSEKFVGKTFEVDRTREHCNMLVIYQGDASISFGCESISEDTRQWLGAVLSRQVNELVEIRVREALEDHKKAMRKLLGV